MTYQWIRQICQKCNLHTTICNKSLYIMQNNVDNTCTILRHDATLSYAYSILMTICDLNNM
jgi:hypothetical protein